MKTNLTETRNQSTALAVTVACLITRYPLGACDKNSLAILASSLFFFLLLHAPTNLRPYLETSFWWFFIKRGTGLVRMEPVTTRPYQYPLMLSNYLHGQNLRDARMTHFKFAFHSTVIKQPRPCANIVWITSLYSCSPIGHMGLLADMGEQWKAHLFSFFNGFWVVFFNMEVKKVGKSVNK